MGWMILDNMLNLLTILILVRVVMSFVVDPHSRNPLVELVRSVTDVILRPLQSVLPSAGPFDFSPMVAILLIQLVRNLLQGAMY